MGGGGGGIEDSSCGRGAEWSAVGIDGKTGDAHVLPFNFTMNSLFKFLQFGFIPRSADFALLVLRIWLGVSMLALHGWGKVSNFGGMASRFADPFGFGPTPSLVLAIIGEFVCAALLALGLLTRFSALVLAVVMATAFFVAHGAKLSGPGNGELPFIYLAGYLVIFFAGPGRFSIDRKLGAAV